jgi:hypothetical protein
MNSLDPVLQKVAADSPGFLSDYLRSKGVQDDFNHVPSVGQALKNQIPELAGNIASAGGYGLHLGSQLLRLGDNLAKQPAANKEAPELSYAKLFSKYVGDPTKAGWKDTLYRLTSASDGQSLGSWGLGPSLMSIVNQFRKPSP